MTSAVHPIDLWLADLAVLLNPSQPDEAQRPLRALRGHLATFDLAAFTRATARDVAAAKRFGPIPSWDVIEPILAKAGRDAYAARVARLPAPPSELAPEPPSADERARISAMVEECRRMARITDEKMRLNSPRPPPAAHLDGDALQAARHAVQCQRAGIGP